MSFVHMAVDTLHVVALGGHVNIHMQAEVKQCSGQISVLDVVTSTSIKMAFATVLPLRLANVLGNSRKGREVGE